MNWLHRFLDRLDRNREARHLRALRKMRVVLPAPREDDRSSLLLWRRMNTYK
jgi:hypothetical protein